MKVNVNMAMTPEEARKLMGLPDMEPLQKAMMEKMQAQMEAYFSDITDPEAMFQKFMPMGIQAMEQYKNFIAAMAATNYNTSNTDANNTDDSN